MSKDPTAPQKEAEFQWLETDADVYIRRITHREMREFFPQIDAEGDVDWHATFSGRDGAPHVLSTNRETAIGHAIQNKRIIHPVN